MRDAISERLADLIAVARQLQILIDGETPDALLPTPQLCSLARVVDGGAAELRRQLNALIGAPPLAQDAAGDAEAAVCPPRPRRRF